MYHIDHLISQLINRIYIYIYIYSHLLKNVLIYYGWDVICLNTFEMIWSGGGASKIKAHRSPQMPPQDGQDVSALLECKVQQRQSHM